MKNLAHYLLTPQHLKGVIWVALKTPSREGIVGQIVRRRKAYYTEPYGGVGCASGPHDTQDAAVRALIKHAEKPTGRGKR